MKVITFTTMSDRSLELVIEVHVDVSGVDMLPVFTDAGDETLVRFHV